MTEVENIGLEDQADMTPWPPQIVVSAADFRSIDYNMPARLLKMADLHRLETELMTLAKSNRGTEPGFSVYRILAAICSLHFSLHDKAGPFGPQMTFNNSRTPIPEDWIGVQNDYFSEILEEVEHPALRARLADVVWTNDRKKGSAAAIAIQAYCDCADKLIDGEFSDRFTSSNDVSLEVVDLVERASQIHARSHKRSAPMNERVAELLGRLYGKARAHLDIVPLKRIATVRSRFSLMTMDQLAVDMEEAAATADGKSDIYPLAIKELWDLAAFAHGEAKRVDNQRRCQLAAVEETLKMAPQTGSASGAAHWYRQAIGELREIPGTQERREELRKEMRKLQELALEEMGSFEIPLDLSDIVTGTIEVFGKLSLPEGLKQFALLARPPNSGEIKREALASGGGIADIFSATHLDTEGKIVAEVEGAPLEGSAPSEAWVKSKMVQALNFKMEIAVRGQLGPARSFLNGEFPLAERHFHFIVVQSPFVPLSHAATFALGFARLMQGDFLSAAPILIPQLEYCLRYVLVNSSTDTSKMRNDLTQEDRSLSTLLETYRKELTAIFGEDNTMLIDLLFNHRPGPALRHEFAHGKVGDSSHGDPSIYFACCFIYFLVCTPLFRNWTEHVAPAMEAGSF